MLSSRLAGSCAFIYHLVYRPPTSATSAIGMLNIGAMIMIMISRRTRNAVHCRSVKRPLTT